MKTSLIPECISRATLLAAASLALSVAAQAAQVGSTSNAGTRTPIGQSVVTTGPSQQPLALLNGAHYWPEGNAAMVGWTVDYDETAGDFVLVKPLMIVTPNNNTGVGSHRTFVENQTASSYAFRSSVVSASAGYSSMVVSASAQLALSNETLNNTLGGTITLAYESEYPDSIVDLVNINTASLHPDAQAVLALPQSQRATAWRNAGFGPFIAYGYGLKGAAGLKLTFDSLDTMVGRNTFLHLKASYSGVSASASIGLVVKEALEQGHVTIEHFVRGTNQYSFAIPSLAELSDQTQRVAWENSVLSTAMNAKQMVGLWLIPADALAAGLSSASPNWDGFLLNQASIVANDTLWTLSRASAWNRPYSLRDFINVRPMDPTRSYGVALNEERQDVVDAMQGLAVAVLAYMDPAHTSDPAFSQAVSSAAAHVVQERSELDSVLVALDQMVYGLPPIQLEVRENWTPVGACGGNTWHEWVQFQYRVKNFASFATTNPYPLGAQMMISDVNAPQESTLLVRDHDLCNNWHGFRSLALGTLRNPTVSNETYLAGGPGAGLWDFYVRFEALCQSAGTHNIDARMYDALGRSVELQYVNLDADNSF